MLLAEIAPLDWLFGGDLPRDPLLPAQVAARAAITYVVGILIVRVGKSRGCSAAPRALDVILGFILGSLLSRGITGHASLSGTAVASAALVFVHWSFTALAFRWHWFGLIFKGESRSVIRDGKLQRDALRRPTFPKMTCWKSCGCRAWSESKRSALPSKSETEKSA